LQAVWERVREHGLKVPYIDLYNVFRRYDREGVEWAHFDPDVLDYGSLDAFWESLYDAFERLGGRERTREVPDRLEEYAYYLASIGAHKELEKLAKELEEMGERRVAERVRQTARRGAREAASTGVKPAVLVGRKAAIAEALRALAPGRYTFQELLEHVNKYLAARGYRPTNAVGLARVLKAMGMPYDKKKATVYVLGAVEKRAVALAS